MPRKREAIPAMAGWQEGRKGGGQEGGREHGLENGGGWWSMINLTERQT